MWYDLLFSVCCLCVCFFVFFLCVFLRYDMGVSPAINTNNNNNNNNNNNSNTTTNHPLVISKTHSTHGAFRFLKH